jgi:hypothetical protein
MSKEGNGPTLLRRRRQALMYTEGKPAPCLIQRESKPCLTQEKCYLLRNKKMRRSLSSTNN